jgi:hypothetical protein
MPLYLNKPHMFSCSTVFKRPLQKYSLPKLLPFTCALGILSRVKIRVYKTNKFKRITIFLLLSYSGNTL